MDNVSVNLDDDFSKGFAFVKEQLGIDVTQLDFTWLVSEREVKIGEKIAYVDPQYNIHFYVNQDLKSQGNLWIVVAHELYHLICRMLNDKNIRLVDEMDATFVDYDCDTGEIIKPTNL